MTSFDWNELKNVADELATFNDEAHIRSAFGRYYYAPYCSTRFYLVNLGLTNYLGVNGSHKNLYEDLQNSPDENEVKLGNLLEKLFEKRVDADYLLEKDGKKLDANYFIKKLPFVEYLSNEALSLINILIKNPPSHRFNF